MSLLNLLKVGHSFLAIEDHPSRYRMIRENLLPRFGAGEINAAHPELPLDSEGVADAQVESLPGTSPASTGAGVASMPQSYPADPSARNPMTAYPGGRWNLKPPFPFGRGAKSGRATEPVQRELPWEEIPVARNDLSEADVEVVRPTAVQRASSAEMAGERRLVGRVTGRWFGGARK